MGWCWVFLSMLASLSVAQAAPPVHVQATLAPLDAPEQFMQWVGNQAAPGPDLACQVHWPGVALLCFRVTEGERRRWVTTQDLKHWGVSLQELIATVSASLPPQCPGSMSSVEGMKEMYWRAEPGEHWACALLAPQRLAERLGTKTVLVAVPAQGVLLAWSPGSDEMNTVMAVGVREMFDALDGPVSPWIMRFTGTTWVALGEAVPAKKIP